MCHLRISTIPVLLNFPPKYRHTLFSLLLPHLLVWCTLFLADSHGTPASSLPCRYHYSIITIHIHAHTHSNTPHPQYKTSSPSHSLSRSHSHHEGMVHRQPLWTLSLSFLMGLWNMTPQSSTEPPISKYDATPLRLQGFPCWPACEKKHSERSPLGSFFSREPRL